VCGSAIQLAVAGDVSSINRGNTMQKQDRFESVAEQALEAVSGGLLGSLLGSLTGGLGSDGGIAGLGGLGGLDSALGADLLGELLGVLPIPL